AVAFMYVSREQGESIKQMALRKEFQVVSNVVDTNLFFFIRPYPPQQKFRFIHVSGMPSNKNPKGILRVFAQLYSKQQNAELIMVGPCQKDVCDVARQTGLLDKTIF